MRRLSALAGLALVPVLVMGVFFVLPVSGMLALGLWPDGDFSPFAVLEVLGRPRVGRVLWFTVWSASVATLATLALGIPTAYVLHRLRFPGRTVLRALFLVPFVLPTVVVGIAFKHLLGGPLAALDLEGTPVAIIAAMVFFNLAVVVRTVGTAWEGLDPRSGEAAAALGATPWQVFRTATLPALRGSIISAASVVFLFCATAFGVVLILGGLRYATIETEVYLLTTTLFDLPAAAALCLLQLVVVTLLLYAAHRARSGSGTSVERRAVAPVAIRRRDLPALGIMGLGMLLVTAPVLDLVAGSFRVQGGWGLGNYRSLGTVGEGSLVEASVLDALLNSLRTAVDATWMALLLGLLVSVIVTRRSHSTAERRMRGVLDGFFMLPLGVSAVTLGFGFLITLDEPPVNFRDSALLVPIAQALVALPLVVRTLVPVLAGIDDRQRQAANSLGASPLRALLTIDLAVVWKPLLAAGGFAFAISLGEFGATSFLSRVDHPTLPVIIFRLLGEQGADNYGMALAASVILALTTALVMLVVERLRVPGVGGF
ncbi:thiamine transport system permease protein [Nocardioides daedukensis]|uniref:Thiamine transport system permease protein n=1 Tax=Nocardioides daedukensis TaxID=634462 RepID=A0A7Y9UQ65_9ACTN|nr:thiamine transport system permease protein [Nocardioides daedukensis]